MGKQLVNLPLTENLTDTFGNLTSGSCVRASARTGITSSGVLTEYAINVPVYEEYGLSINGEGTNILLYSYDFTQWTNSNSTDDKNATGPNATANAATTITNTDADGYISLATGALAAASHTFSIFVKAGNSGDFTLMIYDTTASATKAEIDFSVTAGVVAVAASDTGSGGIRALSTTGWYKVYCTTAAAVLANEHEVRFYPGRRGASAAGDTTIIYGAQLEAKAFMTSYIPTNGAPAVRLTEAGSAANGYYWTQSAAFKNALVNSGASDTDTKSAGTLILDFVPGHLDAHRVVGAYGIVTARDNPDYLLYLYSNATRFITYDDTNNPHVTRTLSLNTTYTVALRFDKSANSGDGYLQVSEKHGGVWTHGTATNYDGTLVSLFTSFRLAYGNEYPFWIRNIRFYDGWVKDANLDSPRARMLFPILPLFGGVKPYQY